MTDRRLAGFLLAVAMASAACLAADDKPKPLTLEQRKRLLKLVGQLRRPTVAA